MDARESDERAWRRKTAHLRCPRCGAQSLKRVDGAAFRDDFHFPGLTYKACAGCGFEVPLTRRNRGES